jgi:hypothetical protein
MPSQSLSIQLSPLLRVVNRDKSLPDIIRQAMQNGSSAHAMAPLPDVAIDSFDDDPTVIDLSLHIDDSDGSVPDPTPGTGYAGLSPRQRYRFLTWASQHPDQPAPPAFQQLYLAHLEVRFLEGGDLATQARQELPRLWRSSFWQTSLALARTQLLAFWLAQDSGGLAAWIGLKLPPPSVAGVAIGCQALLGRPLDARQVAALCRLWALGDPLSIDILRLRLSSLEANLGRHPLAHALEQLPAEATAPKPWRATHRSLRLVFPQPDLRGPLTPLLLDLLSLPGDTPLEPRLPVAVPEEPAPDRGWQLIMEFGSSRSEYFEIVLRNAQKLPGYTQLMDENRQLVHRIIFKKSDMRRFWRIWDYVQSWSSTRVYLNGEELEKWKIWPYSQYLR